MAIHFKGSCEFHPEGSFAEIIEKVLRGKKRKRPRIPSIWFDRPDGNHRSSSPPIVIPGWVTRPVGSLSSLPHTIIPNPLPKSKGIFDRIYQAIAKVLLCIRDIFCNLFAMSKTQSDEPKLFAAIFSKSSSDEFFDDEDSFTDEYTDE